MERFGSGRSSSVQTSDYKSHVALYQRLRPLRLRLNDELVSRLSSEAMREGARKLGLLRDNTFAFDTEDEMPVLMDYCIYDVYRNGRNAVDNYLCDCPPDSDSDEMTCLHAMQHATYTMIAVLDVNPGVGCVVRNLFTDETRLLVDIGLSKTAQRGGLVLTRLLDFGEFVATSGAALPLGILDDDELDDWQQRLRSGIHDENFDPAPLIHESLHRGASSNVIYEEPGAGRHPSNDLLSSWGENRSKQKRQPVTREARKPPEKRRCRCGSGKMFKNCCGKR